MVGAVVARGDEVVGLGWHRRAGTPHAEVLALEQAGGLATGATLYVTLEPCAHHGRTPPCINVVKSSGLSRVVVAMKDPDSRVAGKGVASLKRSIMKIEVGLKETEARKLNEAYIVHRTESRPFLTYKAAMSLDGRTAAADGSSKWITGPEARSDVQRLRAASDAICVGIGTVLADDPSLTVREVTAPRPPVRVIVDSKARTPVRAKVLSGEAPTIIAVAEGVSRSRVNELSAAGADVVELPAEGERLSLKHLAEMLAGRKIVSLLVEGGATLAGGFEAAGLIDRYVFYIAPKFLGAGHALLEGWSARTLSDARSLTIESTKRLGDDMKIIARPSA